MSKRTIKQKLQSVLDFAQENLDDYFETLRKDYPEDIKKFNGIKQDIEDVEDYIINLPEK